MNKLVLESSSTAQWHSLVRDAEQACKQNLPEEIESYLVFLLMRFCRCPEMAGKVMALQYLKGIQETGQVRQDTLRDVGDQCLLYAGLFPQQAERRRVRISYFIDLGQAAYHSLSSTVRCAFVQLYLDLAEQFVCLRDILQTMREMNGQPALLPLATMELWQDTGSMVAHQILTERYQGGIFPVCTRVSSQRKH